MTENNILRTALIQQHNTADTADNRRRLAEKVREAARSGARLVVLQELHDTLYFCQQTSAIWRLTYRRRPPTATRRLRANAVWCW